VIVSMLALVYKKLKIPVRIHRTWACGYRTSAQTQYSATGFAGPIRRFFSWLYKPKEHFHKENLCGHESKFSTALYEVHVSPLFEKSLYRSVKDMTTRLSYYIYRLAHFEQSRYPAMIFNLVLAVLFGYRVMAYDFSWSSFLIEATILVMSIKILVIGEKRR